MRVDQQSARHGEAASLESDGHPASRATTHDSEAPARAARSASLSAFTSEAREAASTTDSTGVDRAASMTAGTSTAAASTAVKTPCSIPRSAIAIRRSWRGSAKPSAERMAASRVAGSAMRSCPTATAWMTYGAGRSPPYVATAMPGPIGPCSTAARSTSAPARCFTPVAAPAVMNNDSLAATTTASTSSSAISPCQTSMSTRSAMARPCAPTALAQRGGDLVVDRATLVGDVVRGDPHPLLLADEHEFVAVGYTRHSADIDGEAVHADRADDRYALPPHEGKSVVC